MRKRSNHIYLFLFLCILVGFVFFGVHLVSLFATMCIILNPLLQCFREPSLKEWCSRPSSRIFKIIRRLLCWPLAFMCSSFYIAFMCAVCSGSLERERERANTATFSKLFPHSIRVRPRNICRTRTTDHERPFCN